MFLFKALIVSRSHLQKPPVRVYPASKILCMPRMAGVLFREYLR